MHGCDSIIGCLVASTSLVNRGIDATVTRIGDVIKADASRVGNGLDVSVHFVCSAGEVVDMYVPFLVTEGVFILADGGIFKVLRT
jgi:hypothetical protein